MTSGKKLSQCRERTFKQIRFLFMSENVRVCCFLNSMEQAVPSLRASTGKTAFDKLQPSCQSGSVNSDSFTIEAEWTEITE